MPDVDAPQAIGSTEPGSPEHDCTVLSACEQQPQHVPNATCGVGCFDWCWKTDVGDCADMDDEQAGGCRAKARGGAGGTGGADGRHRGFRVYMHTRPRICDA